MIPLSAVRTAVLAAVGLATFLPSGVEAETLADSVTAATRVEMLNSMHDQAWAIAQKGTPAALETAIMLHGQVVHRRAADDPHRVECLRTHARLLYHYGRADAALMYMEAAGTQAATEGRDFEAALSFIEAAILADKLGQTETVRRLRVDANRILAGSSELDSVERVAIRSRLGL